jgi:hypothetical protein
MRKTMPPPLVPSRDGTVYLVLDDFGEFGRAYREAQEAQADRQTVLADLVSGQYEHPLRIVAFNTAEGWARDVTAEIAREVLARAVALDNELPPHVHEFVERASRKNPAVSVSSAPKPVRPGLNPGDDPSRVRDAIVRP